ncbi:MAG: hypothetical protein R3A10_14210 [Caldilineaceae bacterium]
MAAPAGLPGRQLLPREVVRDEGAFQPTRRRPARPAAARTEMDWRSIPRSLPTASVAFRFEYSAPKLYVTENGASYSDGPGADGRIHDERAAAPSRCAVHAPWQPVCRWRVSSSGPLMNNFEWA